MTSPIDFRSDTVTTPTPAMLEAMRAARVGDDVLGDDPTVIELQERCAQLFGKQAACFVPSGTMANLCSIRAHSEPGDEIIAHKHSHILIYEGGGYAAVGGCSAAGVRSKRGQFTAGDVVAHIRGDDHHYPKTKLVWIENTHNLGGGSVWPIDRLAEVSDAAHENGLRVHIDGARIWNASVASGVSLADIAAHADTVSACFSKGLGCPVGSIVVGESKTIARVHRLRKMLGGAMRQSGILAAAALHALDHHVERLAEDHANAKLLAQGLAAVGPIDIDPASVETNLVYMQIDSAYATAQQFCDHLDAQGVRMLAEGPQVVRAVTHLQITREMIERTVEIISQSVRATASL